MCVLSVHPWHEASGIQEHGITLYRANVDPPKPALDNSPKGIP